MGSVAELSFHNPPWFNSLASASIRMLSAYESLSLRSLAWSVAAREFTAVPLRDSIAAASRRRRSALSAADLRSSYLSDVQTRGAWLISAAMECYSMGPGKCTTIVAQDSNDCMQEWHISRSDLPERPGWNYADWHPIQRIVEPTSLASTVTHDRSLMLTAAAAGAAAKA